MLGDNHLRCENGPARESKLVKTLAIIREMASSMGPGILINAVYLPYFHYVTRPCAPEGVVHFGAICRRFSPRCLHLLASGLVTLRRCVRVSVRREGRKAMKSSGIGVLG